MTTSSATRAVEKHNYCYLRHFGAFLTQRWRVTTFFYRIEYPHANRQLALGIVDGS
jgi:hypothetical protein